MQQSQSCGGKLVGERTRRPLSATVPELWWEVGR